MSALIELLRLSRWLGESSKNLVILAEGNASALEEPGLFWVKASGKSLGDLTAEGVVRLHAGPLLESLLQDNSDAQVMDALTRSKADRSPLKPSVEAFMHAYLLTLPGVRFVAHTHPTVLLSLLCVESAKEIASKRLFPDEIVCCGPETCFVDYEDPGVELAKAIQRGVQAYVQRHTEPPKTIWLQNHGLIALGGSVAEVESATLMSVKAAEVWLGALGTGRPIKTLDACHVNRIHSRPDEHYRQKQLWRIEQTQ